ncbi:MAG TPA: hypothetical protein PLI84_09510 [Ornithinibacter sp.]|jgi:hypothetical protein|nr:hypothetical protein [Ornithinibacter sp.]
MAEKFRGQHARSADGLPVVGWVWVGRMLVVGFAESARPPRR